ncbi:MAG: hypothetical protein H7338_17570 [Candidatus Sericytochromatia bacterium]|nr:hypothetical protein [Candidatus Sericytochromatia bacterium]
MHRSVVYLTAVSLAILMPSASVAADVTAPLQRGKKTHFGFIFKPTGQTDLFGTRWVDSESKMFRLNSSDKTIFRGIGQDNDVVEFIWPTYAVKPELRQVLGNSKKVNAHLGAYERMSSIGGTIEAASVAASIAGFGMFAGGLLPAMSAKGDAVGALINPFFITGSVVMLASLVTSWFVAGPMFTIPAQWELQYAVDAYNIEHGYKGE